MSKWGESEKLHSEGRWRHSERKRKRILCPAAFFFLQKNKLRVKKETKLHVTLTIGLDIGYFKDWSGASWALSKAFKQLDANYFHVKK